MDEGNSQDGAADTSSKLFTFRKLSLFKFSLFKMYIRISDRTFVLHKIKQLTNCRIVLYENSTNRKL